jgi:hypothetical protein
MVKKGEFGMRNAEMKEKTQADSTIFNRHSYEDSSHA